MWSLGFLRNFLRNPLRNASVVPSSARATREMVANIDFTKVEYIVELGPGTGVFTKAICDAARPNTKIIVLELENSYIESLENRFGNKVDVIHASADELPNYVMQRGWPRVDLIISGLPFVLPTEVKNRLFNYLLELTSSGTMFRWFTYMPVFMKPHYKDFDMKPHAFVWQNLPPMWIYQVN